MNAPPPADAGPTPDPPRGPEEIFGLARELEGEERRDFVRSACEGRPDVEREVLQLLGRSDPADAFFGRLESLVDPLRSRAHAAMRDGSGAEVPATAAAEPGSPGPDLPPGTEVGSYRVLARIGSGGMGTVYSARDPRLDRDVALKLLPTWMAADPRAAERFRNEARAAAALDHPNICTIYEIGEARDGHPFIAMALYRGETLRERLDRGPLPVAEAVEIAAAIARALAAAHARGIIHRDVKPGNVMLTGDGRVKLLDFGLARLEDDTGTRPGLLRGTVSYMAPEQVRGQPAGPAADLWALGVVLYEMLAGRRPFTGGRDRARFHAILHDAPAPLEDSRPEVPAALAGVVERLLRKDPAERHADADELLADLTGGPDGTRVRTARPSASESRRRLPALRTPGRRAALAAAGAVVVGLAAFAAWRLHGAGAPALDDHLIAVLPFRVQGADPSLADLHEGMMDLVADELKGTPDARAVEPDAVLAAVRRVEGTEDGAITPGMAVDVARRVGARHALVASVFSLPGRIRIRASLYDASDGRAETTVNVDGTPDSLVSLGDRLVGQVMGIRAGEGKGLGSLTTEPLSALRLYLNGKVAYRNGRYDEATRDFARAVRIDSTFALAALQTWIAAESGSARNSPGVAAFFDMAWRHRDRLSLRDKEFVEYLAGPGGREGHPSVRQLLESRRTLTRLQPDNPQAWYMLGIYIPGAERALGFSDSVAFADAVVAERRALTVDSAFLPALRELWNDAVALADTAAMRRYASLSLARSRTGMDAEVLTCVESALDGDRPSVARIMARADSAGGAVPGRCLFMYHHLPMLSAVRDSAEDFLWRRFRWDLTPLGKEGASILYDIQFDTGRPTHAAAIGPAYFTDFHWDFLTSLAWRIRAALWWDGDRREATRWVDALSDTLAAEPPDAPGTPGSNALCVLGEWRLTEGDTARAGRVIRKLRALGRDGRLPDEADAYYCTRLLVAWRAAEEGATDAGARLDSLAFNQGDEPSKGWLHREGYLEAASLLERRGDLEAALTSVRHAHATMPPIYMSTVLRERGRLAAEVGDTAEARDAYRRYLALRTRPEPALVPEVEKVRKALVALGG